RCASPRCSAASSTERAHHLLGLEELGAHAGVSKNLRKNRARSAAKSAFSDWPRRRVRRSSPRKLSEQTKARQRRELTACRERAGHTSDQGVAQVLYPWIFNQGGPTAVALACGLVGEHLG